MTTNIDRAAEVIEGLDAERSGDPLDIAQALAAANLLAPEATSVVTSEKEFLALDPDTPLRFATGFVGTAEQRTGIVDGKRKPYSGHLPASVLTPAPAPRVVSQAISVTRDAQIVAELRKVHWVKSKVGCACGDLLTECWYIALLNGDSDERGGAE